MRSNANFYTNLNISVFSFMLKFAKYYTIGCIIYNILVCDKYCNLNSFFQRIYIPVDIFFHCNTESTARKVFLFLVNQSCPVTCTTKTSTL